MHKMICQQCKRLGYTTKQEPKAIGRCSSGEMVYWSRTVPINRRCEACSGSGKADAAVFPVPAITFGRRTVDASGFTAEKFERAIYHALVDQLEIHRDASGEVTICHAGQNGGYRTTRHSRSCKAGKVGTPCKHRALVCFHLDVRELAIHTQWAEARKAVAA